MAEKPGKIELEIVTPEKVLFSESSDMVVVPGSEGDFGVLVGHAPFLSQIRAGTIDIYDGNKINVQVFVEGGIAEVTPKRCTILAEVALMVADIDKTFAKERLLEARANQESNTEHVDGMDTSEVVAAEAQVLAANS
jgi:F-type H+-transporting ATPase subunit epsilon